MLTLPRALDAVPNSDYLAVAVRHSVPFSDSFVCVVLEMRHVVEGVYIDNATPHILISLALRRNSHSAPDFYFVQSSYVQESWSDDVQ